MQGILIAVVSTIGLVLSAVIVPADPARRLNRAREECELYSKISENFTAERQLLRYALHESLWEYVIVRRKLLSLGRYLAGSFGGLALMMVGTIAVSSDSGSSWQKEFGPLLIYFGAVSYLAALASVFLAVPRRIRQLQGPPPRIRQLIAAEASLLDDTDLRSFRRGQPQYYGNLFGVLTALSGKQWRQFDAMFSTELGTAEPPEGDRADDDSPPSHPSK